MALTLRHFFSKSVTVQYPYEKLKLKDRFRGQITLVIDAETNEPRCTACGLCAKVCPDRLIKVEAVKVDKKRVLERWQVNLGGCMFCGLCVETCPFGGIVMTDNYELAEYDRKNLIYGKERLLKTAVVKAKEPKAPKTEEKVVAKRVLASVEAGSAEKKIEDPGSTMSASKNNNVNDEEKGSAQTEPEADPKTKPQEKEEVSEGEDK
jgi:NADH-quinone oxidoreductase subunit I